jgi:glycosyltransferase involved in cell wall biosynthesis
MAELVEHLGREGGFHNTVLSPVEGPLRTTLEASAANVHVGSDFMLDDLAEYEREQSRLSSWMKGRFDLVIGFTVSSFPVIEAARRLGVPSVLRIGEAAPLSTVLSWIGVPIVPAVEDRAQQAFAKASVLMSNSHAAVESYRANGFDGRFVVVGTGVDVAGASGYSKSTDRLGTRRRLGIRTNERLLFCGASLWPIKGQALLVEALDQLHQKYPDLTCVLMGDADTDYADAIRSFVARHGLADVVRILPFQADLRPWWIAADAAVCSSESESLPAAVLEAMVFGLPVLSCCVGDVPLVVEDGISGWLVDHSDLEALVCGLESVATTSPERLRMMGQAAARSAARHFDSTAIFDRTTNLLRTTANGVTVG